MKNLTLLLLFVSVLVFGCSSKEPVYRSVYEGLKFREQIVHPSDEPVPTTMPSYDEYSSERERILKKPASQPREKTP